MKLLFFIMLFVSILISCEGVENNLQLAKGVSNVDEIIGNECTSKLYVASQYANEKLLFVKLIFMDVNSMTCSNKKLVEILDLFLNNKIGYSKNTEFFIEYTKNNEQILEKMN